MDYLQAQNQLKTFAAMTGGMSFSPLFQGALPDVFADINNSIRNQYVLTYRPTNNKNDGSYRKVKVLLVDNEGHPLACRTKKANPRSTPSSPATATTPNSPSNDLRRYLTVT